MHSLLSDPRLADCRRLFLRDFELPVHIGVHDFEQGSSQRLRFNVDLYVALADSTPQGDRISEVVDYDFVRQRITERVQRGHVQLQETLADDVLQLMLAHPGVRAACVSTEKPDVYPDCAAVGVEVFGLKEAR
ncbi:MAG: dihydroneopterin aldolase [Rubrivivax sp.]|nr:dihydroneopterin aldolase [Rubrivivax sp.]MBK7264214.1 dihydroneopterin aldolase [Rubrivivax sp.]